MIFWLILVSSGNLSNFEKNTKSPRKNSIKNSEKSKTYKKKSEKPRKSMIDCAVIRVTVPNWYKCLVQKKCYPLSFPILGGRDLIIALQSSPFQNPGGVAWAWRTEDGRTNEILLPNLGCSMTKGCLAVQPLLTYTAQWNILWLWPQWTQLSNGVGY